MSIIEKLKAEFEVAAAAYLEAKYDADVSSDAYADYFNDVSFDACLVKQRAEEAYQAALKNQKEIV